MENTSIDKITKNILNKSRMEITDPGFSRMVMNKIMIEERKKIFTRNILSLCFILGIVAIYIYLFLQSLQINNIDFATLLSNLGHEILTGIEKTAAWIIENEYFILPVIVILIFKKIIDSRVKYS